MTLIRWTPAASHCGTSRPEMDRLFDNFLATRSLPMQANDTMAPPVDIEETDEAFVLRADLPGIDSKDIKVRLKSDVLTLRAERKRDAGQKDGAVHRLERTYGVYERAFTIKTPVRGDQVKATYRDGVLEIRCPKSDEARVREIDVQVG